jgi:hypothetical protein
VRSYSPVVEKPLIGGDWAGVLSSKDACRLSHSYPKWRPADSPGREDILNIERTENGWIYLLVSGGRAFLW